MQKINNLETRIFLLEKKIVVLEKILLIRKNKKTKSEDIYKNIVLIICNYFDISYFAVCSKNRIRKIVYCRQICHYFGKQLNLKGYINISLSKIGEIAGLKDHATVLYSNKVINDLLTYNTKIQNDVRIVEDLIIDYLKSEKENL